MSFSICATLAAAFAVTVRLAAGQGSQDPNIKTLSATGVVTSVSARSLVIEGTGKRSMTFALDSKTRVFSRGRAGFRAFPLRPGEDAAGSAITDVVQSGDRVTVRFQIAGIALKAIEIRVLAK